MEGTCNIWLRQPSPAPLVKRCASLKAPLRSIFESLLFALLLGLGTAFAAVAQPIDQLPMYGGFDRHSDASLRFADEKLITDTFRHYGRREKAGAAFINNGFALYGRDDLANAMRRLNQAWILDPNNPEVYFGFAVVLHDQGKVCEAASQFEKAASFHRYVQGMAPDAARVMVLCAVNDKSSFQRTASGGR